MLEFAPKSGCCGSVKGSSRRFNALISEINDKLAQPGVEATEEAGLAGSWCSSLVTIAHPCLPCSLSGCAGRPVQGQCRVLQAGLPKHKGLFVVENAAL